MRCAGRRCRADAPHRLEPGWPSGIRPCCSQTSRSKGAPADARQSSAGYAPVERRAASDGERVVGIEREHRDQLARRLPPARRTRRRAARRGPTPPPWRATKSAAATPAPPPRQRRSPLASRAKGSTRSWRGQELRDSAADQASRSTAGVKRPSQSAETEQAPAAARSRRRFGEASAIRPRRPSRPAVDNREHEARQPEETQKADTRGSSAGAVHARSRAPRARSRSSLKNGPKGGHAVTANMPVTKIAAERGVSTAMPRTSSIVRRRRPGGCCPRSGTSAPLVRLLPHT